MQTKFTKEKPTRITGKQNTIALKNFRGEVIMLADAPDNIELITAFENAMLNHDCSTIINHLNGLQ